MTDFGGLIARARFFEFYARRLWPLHRLLVRRRLARRCRNCALSERCSPLVDGLCPECLDGAPAKTEDPASALCAHLDEVLRLHAGAGNGRYDALVLVSGGKDSALLLHRLKRNVPGLRLLALCIDQGFFSPVAMDNAIELCRNLAVDLEIVRPRASLFRRAFRHALTHLGNAGCSEIIDRMDGDLLHDIGRHVAAERAIPLLITGMSRTQVRTIFGVDHFEMPREGELRRRRHSAGFDLANIFPAEELAFWWDPSRYRESRIARVLFPFYAWNLSETRVRNEVARLGLIPPGRESPLVTNNALIPAMGMIDVRRRGYSSFEPEFSAMARRGQADAKRWRNIFELLEYCGKTGWLLKAEVDRVLADLGLKLSDEPGVGVSLADNNQAPSADTPALAARPARAN